MLTIELPDELAERLAAEAARRGVSAEALALRWIDAWAPLETSMPAPGESMLDQFKDVIGIIDSRNGPYVEQWRKVRTETPERGAQP